LKADPKAMTQAPQLANRLAYIDWMRGLACVLMFQTHCYNSWLNPEARKSALYAWSQLGGTLPAPLFIFLSGISLALVTEKLRERGAARSAIAKKSILRGAEIYGLGILFRIQEYILGYPISPWTDLFRVDILNILGISMMLMGALCWLTSFSAPAPGSTSQAASGAQQLATWRSRAVFGALAAAAFVVLVTPPLWTIARPRWLPWPLESYLNGVHVYGRPQSWLFPIFPWFRSIVSACETKSGLDVCSFRRRRSCHLCPCPASRRQPGSSLRSRNLRLLAHQSKFLPDALRDSAYDLVSGVCVVPLGIRADGLQPCHPTRTNLAAGLLGAHRIRIRASLYSA
jgi:hypothetical protein